MINKIDFIFYLTRINDKWYLSAIDRNEVLYCISNNNLKIEEKEMVSIILTISFYLPYLANQCEQLDYFQRLFTLNFLLFYCSD